MGYALYELAVSCCTPFADAAAGSYPGGMARSLALSGISTTTTTTSTAILRCEMKLRQLDCQRGNAADRDGIQEPGKIWVAVLVMAERVSGSKCQASWEWEKARKIRSL